MLAPRFRGALSVFAVAVLSACGSSDTGPNSKTPTAVAIVSGNNQSQIVGAALSSPLVVKVTANGTAVSGVSVTFAVTSGSASVNPASTTTDANGQAKTQVTLGSSPGTVTITATVAGTGLTAAFTAVAGTGSTTVACNTSSPQSPAVGGVLPGVSGTGICLSGGASGAEYAIVAFNSNPDSSTTASVTVQARGATPVATASLAPVFDQAAQAAVVKVHENAAQLAFEQALRTQSKRLLQPLIPAARAAFRRRAAFAAVPANPTIGSLYQFNTQAAPTHPCDAPINITARVAAVSSQAIVVADTANPAGGFTDTEYDSLARVFDTVINPIDVNNFGAPSDIDNNGKIIILFTKEVNKLTPKGSNGVIGGFTHERDLFPKTDTPALQGCAGSNVAEMYYALVPDPTGRFSDVRSKDDVRNDTPGTLVHEYQHLINAGRRIYVNDANDFEDVYLNEGLSHIAEELLFYHETNLAPLQNITTSIFRDSAAVAAFNNVQGANFNRFQVFLSRPTRTSVYAGNDSLEVRGAIWYLLRYLADHHGQPQSNTWQALVNSKTEGKANLAGVFGSDFMTQIRDWATAVFADDIPGVTDSRFLEQSWNMRQIWPRLVNGSGQALGVYPLSVVPLGDASPASLSVIAGGEAYLRFSVAANSQASIDWSTGGVPVSPSMQFTVVRTK